MIDKLAWLTFKDQQLLCARSHGKDIYYIPGGKREPGESDEAALIREIEEELAVALQPDTLRFVCEFSARPMANRQESRCDCAVTPAKRAAPRSPRQKLPSCAGSTAAISTSSPPSPACCLPGWLSRG